MGYDNTNTGALWVNDKEGHDARPDHTGKINIEGKDYRLAAWENTSKAGNPYISLKVSEFEEVEAEPSNDDGYIEGGIQEVPF